jgi:hypothetical protein
MRHITGKQDRPISCYVEDDVAEQIVARVAAQLVIRKFVRFGHYGPADDTFIMWASEKISKIDNNQVKQFKLKNLVVCENYKYRNQGHYINYMSIFNRKDEFKKIATSNLIEEFNKLT